MGWPDDRARAEFAWLRLMARVKYDDYSDFLAGVRFVESLVQWLQQFEPNEREVAYGFIRSQLVYISAAEMQRLVESFYPEVVQSYLLQRIAKASGIPRYRVWSHPGGTASFERLRRKTLFMGLSDGARIDILRERWNHFERAGCSQHSARLRQVAGSSEEAQKRYRREGSTVCNRVPDR
jgi:hypothetical protein